jgi:hypothetical protein
MDHRTVRDRLTRGTAGPDEAAHLEDCPECAAFARRLELAREVLASDAGSVPDPGFAQRVVARLPQPTEVLGWAALRALPAAAALAALLFWLGISQPQSPAHLLAADADPDQLLAWALLSPTGEGQ